MNDRESPDDQPLPEEGRDAPQASAPNVLQESQCDDSPAQPVKAQPQAAAAAAPARAAQPAPGEVRRTVLAVYEHPWAIRFTHWVSAITIFVLAASGMRIFLAFPSFGPKIPQKNFVDIPKALTLGGWLGGALQWHFTFMWMFAACGVLYIAYQLFSGHYKTVLFNSGDVRGVWPMVRHYFFFGPKPRVQTQYNPLQKLAYSSVIACGALALASGLVMYKPVQFSWLGWLLGGYHWARLWHFAALCGFLAFFPGHLIMVALHGWRNFASMLTGWKKDPEYRAEEAAGD